jgi:hypothetical protein
MLKEFFASLLQMLNPTYKSRSEDFRKTFKDIPKDERLIVGGLTVFAVVG